MTTTDEYWYRCQEVWYAPPLDEFENPCGSSTVEVWLYSYRVKKHTPKGVRLVGGRFVLHNATKRYACPTKEQAIQSFLARKNKQISILSRRIEKAKAAMAHLNSKGVKELAL